MPLSPPPAMSANAWLNAPRVLQLRRAATKLAFDSAFAGLARVSTVRRDAELERSRVERIADVRYAAGGAAHTLDVYRPRDTDGPLPSALYIHGGGFRILSKDSHWRMALAFAQRGFVVFNINYRLAPAHPYPAAHEDAAAALRWVLEMGERYGADGAPPVIAGESAGANLTLALGVMSCFERPEPWARAIYETERVPRALLPACGLLQASDPGRFSRRKALPFYLQCRILDASEDYLNAAGAAEPGGIELADPLCILEQETPARPLPPCFAAVGTRDPVLDDTRRLEHAYRSRGGRCEARFYEGEVHAFHSLSWRPAAHQCWQDHFAFLDSV